MFAWQLMQIRRTCRWLELLLLFPWLRVVTSSSRIPSHSTAHRCCLGDHLKIALPDQSQKPYWEYVPTRTPKWSGYLTLMIDALANEMGFTYEFEEAVYGEQGEPVNLLYGDAQLFLSVVSNPELYHPDVTQWIQFTVPFLNDFNTALVYKEVTAPSIWRLFDPFTGGLWLATILCVVFSSLLMVMLSALTIQDGQMTGRDALTPRSIIMSLYHATAALTGGEDYEWLSGPSRLFRLGLLFLILILTATYTANLAAFFTKPQVKVYGPKDLTELRTARPCITIEDMGQFLHLYTGSFIKPTAEDYAQNNVLKFCHDALREKRADVWIAPFTMLNSYLLDHCSDLQLVPSIDILPTRVAFAVASNNSGIKDFMNVAITHWGQMPESLMLLQESFGIGRSCSSTNTVDDTTPIDVPGMGGLFVVFAIVAAAAVVCALIELACHKFRKTEDVIMDHTATEGEMLRYLVEEMKSLRKAAP